MPVQDELIVLPWLELADAHEQLADAERHGEPTDQEQAREYVKRCREQCGELGTLLVVMALEQGSLDLQRRLAMVFDGMAREAYRMARQANHRAKAAEDAIDALKQLVKRLERRIDDLTPGVGEPGRTI